MFVPVPSKIVELNGQPVATKEHIFQLIKDSPMGSGVSFVFAAEPEVIAEADAAYAASTEAPAEEPAVNPADLSMEQIRSIKQEYNALSDWKKIEAMYQSNASAK